MTRENSLAQRVNIGKIPRYIYHYTSLMNKKTNKQNDEEFIQSHIWENLKENSLYFSRPKDFNDPFDSVANFSQNSIKNIFSDIDTKGVFDKVDNPKKISLEFCNILKTIQGICCFSATYNNHLLWSHYASSHTGICLKFDILQDINFFKDDLKFVNYRSIMPSIDIDKSDEDFDFEEMIFTKSLNWSYEQEIRLLKNVTGLLKFNKSSLVEIIFGCNRNEHYCNNFIFTLNQNGYENTNFVLAGQSPTNYNLEFKQMDQKEIENRKSEYINEIGASLLL